MPPIFALLPGRQTGMPPAMQKGCALHTFCVPGDGARIQAALDAAFAVPSGGARAYEAVGERLFVSVAEIAHIYSLDPLDRQRGQLTETDVTVWVLARVAGTLDVRWIPLWLFVDTGAAMATGREVFGFPKQIGQFAFSAPGAADRSFLTQALTLQPFAPQTQAVIAPVILLEPAPPPAAPAPAGLLADLAALAQHVVGELAGAAEAAFLAAASAAVQAGVTTLVFLKQFPDAADPYTACYQAIIEADAKVEAVRSIRLTQGRYQATFTSYDSHPFLDQLGVDPAPQDVGHGVVVDFDFSVGLGAEVWRA